MFGKINDLFVDEFQRLKAVRIFQTTTQNFPLLFQWKYKNNKKVIK